MKVIMSNDWHFGNASNSVVHNEDLHDFIDFMIQWSIDNDVEHFIHGGDFYDSRDKLDVQTIQYAVEGIKKLHGRFGKFPIIKGNHDLYLRDSRDICSLHMFDAYAEVIDFYKVIDNMMLVSWINTQEEYEEIIKVSKKLGIDHIYGHWEFTNFKMNDHYIMEHGRSHRELGHVKNVFSGHYHGRQFMDNVVYIGNPFPYDFNDANDAEKGFCVLDTETGEYEFINYDKVSVLSMPHEEVLDVDWSDVDVRDLTLRVVVEDDIADKDLEKIEEIFESVEFRKTKLVYNRNKKINEAVQEVTEIGHIASVDESVKEHIKQMSDSENVDKNLLIELYEDIL